MVNEQPLGQLVAWVDDQWIPFGNTGGSTPYRLRMINGEVYVTGLFQEIDGQPCNGVAKRLGGQWVPIGNMPPPQGSNLHSVRDILEYNGQLVVTGNINTAEGNDVFILEGDDWVPLGGGLLGWNSYGRRLAVYQGDMYLAGGLSMAEGDIGQCIIRWDGTQWHPVGSGLQVQLGNNGPFGGADDMLIHNNELFVCGGFSYAGGIPARGVARWNGQEWCSVGGHPSNTVFCMGFFQDTLYINNPGTFDGQDLNFVAKFVAPEYENNCGLWVGEEEQAMRPDSFQLHPNPTTGQLHVDLQGIRPREVRLTDALGRVVLQQSLSGRQVGPVNLDLGALASGTYQVTVVATDGMRHTRTVVRE
ncbi:MAG: T9SS type A sorting domain-containing protein [Flavobacteriales bacterium]